MWKELIQTVENQKEKYRKKFRGAWIGKNGLLGNFILSINFKPVVCRDLWLIMIFHVHVQ